MSPDSQDDSRLMLLSRYFLPIVKELPEFDSPAIDRMIVIVDRIDGNAIPASSGPLQIVVPGDKGRGRWVRQLKALTLVLAPPVK